MSAKKVRVNGQVMILEAGATLAQILEQLKIEPKNLAVELNGDFFKLDDVFGRELSDGDRIEIVRFVGGG